MTIRDAHVLPPDVTLASVEDMRFDTRDQLRARPDDFVLARPGARAPTKLVDRNSARFLQLFRTPRRIIDAVRDFSAAEGLDAESTLREVFPLLSQLIDAGILVEEGSEDERPIAARVSLGARVGDWEVVTCVQVLRDIELYQVRDTSGRVAALKIARSDNPEWRKTLEREAMVLGRLDAARVPRLIAVGEYESRPYLVMKWCVGVDAETAAADLRALGIDGRRQLIDLCCAVANAYADLHARGVIHGDVHERNVLVDASGQVCVLDFGLARLGNDDPDDVPRGGIGTYFEPEYAVASSGTNAVPQATTCGEQYSVAAMLFFLYCGAHYVDFSVERREALRQTAADPPLSFAARAVEPFPALERVLATALSKDPAKRYQTTAEFARHLRRVSALGRAATNRRAVDSIPAEATRLAETALQGLDPRAAMFEERALKPPTCSVNFGAAGIACALYRMALAREDATLLAWADAWAIRANTTLGDHTAFRSDDEDLRPEVVGPISLYHSPAGVYVVTALIANAMGDLATLQHAIDRFVQSSTQPCENPDLTLGRSGTLLGCALLLDALPQSSLATTSLRRLGDTTHRGIWSQLADYPDVRDPVPFLNLGIAHGWAGVIYASLRWAVALGRRTDPIVKRRLAQLASCAEPFGRGVRWSWHPPGARSRGQYMQGWCNGGAGFVHVWLLANDVFGTREFEQLAMGAAWATCDGRENDGIDLCCGYAGRAYALLAIYRHTGQREWLRRALRLTRHAAAGFDRHPGELASLYKSGLGTALLAIELERPELARMPLFEHEGWPSRR